MREIALIKADAASIQKFVDSQKLDLEQTRKTGDSYRVKIQQLVERKTKLVKAQNVIDKMVQIVSSRGIGKIESIVTGGLRLVFGKRISFVIDKKEGARGTNYKLLIKKGEVVGNPVDTFGGGVVNVTSFLLRIIMIKRFKRAKFLAIDESFNNVSAEYLPKVSEMIKSLTNDHGFKILAVTHQPELAAKADKVYQVTSTESGPVLELVDPGTVLTGI